MNNLALRSALTLVLVSAPMVMAKEKISLVTEHLPPYQIVDNNNQVTGVSTDIVLEVIKRSNFDYSLNSYPWVRSYNLAQQKENHCIYSIARLPQREKLFKWVGQITEINNAVFWGLKSNKKLNVKTLEDTKKYTTAVNKNDVTHLGLLARGFIEGEHLYVLRNTESLIKLLTTRPEIDLIVADDITIGYRAELVGVKKSDLKRVFEIKDLLLDFHLACSMQTKQSVVDSLRKNLQQVHQDGTYHKILNKWQRSFQ
jgi:polar amino acid transport system substrate-binding protein